MNTARAGNKRSASIIPIGASISLIEKVGDPDFNNPAAWDLTSLAPSPPAIADIRIEDGKLYALYDAGWPKGSAFQVPQNPGIAGIEYEYELDIEYVGRTNRNTVSIWYAGKKIYQSGNGSADIGIFTGTFVGEDIGWQMLDISVVQNELIISRLSVKEMAATTPLTIVRAASASKISKAATSQVNSARILTTTKNGASID